jgi:hypothetical protein
MAYQPPDSEDRGRDREGEECNEASAQRPGGNGAQAIALHSELFLQLAVDLLREKFDGRGAAATLILYSICNQFLYEADELVLGVSIVVRIMVVGASAGDRPCHAGYDVAVWLYVPELD